MQTMYCRFYWCIPRLDIDTLRKKTCGYKVFTSGEELLPCRLNIGFWEKKVYPVFFPWILKNLVIQYDLLFIAGYCFFSLSCSDL